MLHFAHPDIFFPIVKEIKKRHKLSGYHTFRGCFQSEGSSNQGFCVIRLRSFEYLARRALFDDLAVAHDDDFVGQGAHHLQVVADEQIGQFVTDLQFTQRSTIWACTDMSSALVGSSSMTNFGSSTMARAIAMRWRWPPENSCG